MKTAIISLLILIFFLSCSKEVPLSLKELPHTKLLPSRFEDLPHFDEEDFHEVLETFQQNKIILFLIASLTILKVMKVF